MPLLKSLLNKSIKDTIDLQIEGATKKYVITGGSTTNGLPLYKSVNTIGQTYVKSLKKQKKQLVHSKIIDESIKSISLVEL